MANVKISDIVPGTPVQDDELELQRVGGGASYRTSIAAISAAARSLGEAHSTGDYTMGAVTTATPLLGFDVSEVGIGLTVTLTPDAGSNRASFTVDKNDVYAVDCSLEVFSNIKESIDLIININGVPTTFKTGIDLTQNAIDIGNATIHALINLTAGDVVEMYINTDGASMDILIDSVSFTCKRA